MEVKKICIFRSILGSSHVLTEDIEGYNVDWMSSVRGQSECVLKPRTTEEVSRILVALKSVTMFFCVASFSYLAVGVKSMIEDILAEIGNIIGRRRLTEKIHIIL